MNEMPTAHDLSTLTRGSNVAVERYPFLHHFFEEEGMVLHLGCEQLGARFYVNLDPELGEEILAHGITGAQVDESRVSGEGLLVLVVHAGDPDNALNLPYVFALSERGELEELARLAVSQQIALTVLGGTTGDLIYQGTVLGALSPQTSASLGDVSSALLDSL